MMLHSHIVVVICKELFLYCDMYEEDEEITSLKLVQMWMVEGLVKKKWGTHAMDMTARHK